MRIVRSQEPEYRIGTSTTKFPPPSTSRARDHGLSLSVTFLAGTTSESVVARLITLACSTLEQAVRPQHLALDSMYIDYTTNCTLPVHHKDSWGCFRGVGTFAYMVVHRGSLHDPKLT